MPSPWLGPTQCVHYAARKTEHSKENSRVDAPAFALFGGAAELQLLPQLALHFLQHALLLLQLSAQLGDLRRRMQ